MARSGKKRVLFSWSGGKDSSMALHEIGKGNEHEVIALLTTLTEDYDRITMHGVRSALLERQAAALGLPLHKMYIPRNATMDQYEAALREALQSYSAASVSHVGFGDIFLEDVRRSREEVLTTLFEPAVSGAPPGKGGKGAFGDGRSQAMAEMQMAGLFPLWGSDTKRLIRDFISSGFKAMVTCVDSQRLDSSFVGRTIDEDFLKRLPPDVDPCGEHGEYHTFVYDGPIFCSPLSIELGEIVLRQGFYFCDLLS
ncbi:MAG: adenine nucleotide alpha hydrolase [Polyangiaceae bacterium]|nr:adenine nucleotide alpha hydrolase [Polyangiaceae bacterium]